MSTEPQTDSDKTVARSRYNAADYLADILPELSTIARKSGIEELSLHLDRAAKLAREACVKTAS